MKKAIIFVESSNRLLKEEFRKDNPGRIILHRLDSFSSLGLNFEHGKLYGYSEIKGEPNVNGFKVHSFGFDKLFLNPIIDTCKLLELDDVKLGYFLIETNEGISIVDKEYEILEKRYTHNINNNGEDIEHLTLYHDRKEKLKLLEDDNL
jgi:hypothetical protein